MKWNMLLLGLVAGAVGVVGCADERVTRTGTVIGGNVQVGDYAPDFSFLSENGEVETFGSVRGVVTLLVFPDMPEWPDCQRCEDLARLAGKVEKPNTPVVVVSVATACRGDKALTALHRCQIKGTTQLIGLHDRYGRIRGLYGVATGERFFVLDRTGRVTAMGAPTDTGTIREALRSAVAEHEEYWRQLNAPTGG